MSSSNTTGRKSSLASLRRLSCRPSRKWREGQRRRLYLLPPCLEKQQRRCGRRVHGVHAPGHGNVRARRIGQPIRAQAAAFAAHCEGDVAAQVHARVVQLRSGAGRHQPDVLGIEPCAHGRAARRGHGHCEQGPHAGANGVRVEDVGYAIRHQQPIAAHGIEAAQHGTEIARLLQADGDQPKRVRRSSPGGRASEASEGASATPSRPSGVRR